MTNKASTAPPAVRSTTTSIQTSSSSKQDVAKKKPYKMKPYKMEIVWHNVILFIILHSGSLYGVYLLFAESAYIELIFAYIMGFFGAVGITAGAHRLWCHRSYEAKLPLRIFLMLCQTYSFQNHIYEWCRDHRVHHRFVDTDADPHNSKRGFFFSHIGWLMCKKHPDVREKGKQVDMSDVLDDPVVVFQRKYYFILLFFCWFVIPTSIPYYLFGSSFKVSFFLVCLARYCTTLHFTWLVNSVAHVHGIKPYNQNITATNSVSLRYLTYGEGWHNYHHVFPWDYKADEFGNYFNSTTTFLHFMVKIGQAYDLKTASKEMIQKRVQRTGDGTHQLYTDLVNGKSVAHEIEKTTIWRFKNDDVTEEDIAHATIIHKKDD